MESKINSVVVKRKKYLKGHDYVLGKTCFRWTRNIDEARVFQHDNGDGDYWARKSGGKEVILK